MSLRNLCGTSDLKVGHLVIEFATPGIGYMLKHAGADFMLLDMEHSGFGFETAKRIVVAARAAGLPIMIRVPSHDYKDLARACDMGADGIMAPMVSDEAEACAIIAATKYAPEGRRGVVVNAMHDRYTPGSFVDKARAANAHLALFFQIETSEGVAGADAIAAIDGVDCLWLGHMDLSCSLGSPAKFDDPRFVEAQTRVIEAARRNGKSAGRLVRTAEEGEEFYRLGYDILSYSNDVHTYQSALTTGISALRTRTQTKAL